MGAVHYEPSWPPEYKGMFPYRCITQGGVSIATVVEMAIFSTYLSINPRILGFCLHLKEKIYIKVSAVAYHINKYTI